MGETAGRGWVDPRSLQGLLLDIEVSVEKAKEI